MRQFGELDTALRYNEGEKPIQALANMMDIIYEDKALLVVKKPAGVPVQTSTVGQKDMVSILKNYRASKQEDPYIGLVHRLDQPVEGIMVFAKTKQAAANLSLQAAGNKDVQMDKVYHAVVYLKEPETFAPKGILIDYLLRDGKTNLSKVVPNKKEGAKKAVLHYETLQIKEHLAKLQVHLETGRHHQIRVQMAHANCPLVGDRKYGVPECLTVPGMGKNIALCAVSLGFLHPVTNKEIYFDIEPENEAFRLFYN